MLQTQNVKLNSGPLLHKTIKFAPPLANKLNTEYSDLEITIELVENMEEAVQHINKYGSNHTDSIVTKNS
jgi:gamma-glutamyl phosphate reductase